MMLVCAPLNHLKKGFSDWSSTWSHLRYHSSSSASPAQKPSESSRARRAISAQSFTRACFATWSGGWNTSPCSVPLVPFFPFLWLIVGSLPFLGASSHDEREAVLGRPAVHVHAAVAV